MINCRQPEVVCSYEKYLLHLKKTKNKELQKLTKYEHGTSYEKNANEEQHGRCKSEDQGAKILKVAYSKIKEVSVERIFNIAHYIYIYFFFPGEISIKPAKPKIKK